MARIYGTTGADLLEGTEGLDQILGWEDGVPVTNDLGDTLRGLGERDRLWGGYGNDSLLGGLGRDYLYGGPDTDTLRGGDGDDSLFDESNARPNFVVSAASDQLYGEDGNDIIAAIAGRDTLFGGFGDDHLRVGAGSDSVHGGQGFDLVLIDKAEVASDLTFNPRDASTVTILHGEGTRVLGVEHFSVISGSGDDWLAGLRGDDFLFGLTGNDTLFGRDGNDGLGGSDGNDFVQGGDGDDRLEGELGNDELAGGAHRDLLFGGEGDDLVRGGTGSDLLLEELGADTFMGGEGGDVLGTTLRIDSYTDTFFFEGKFGSDRISMFDTNLDVLVFSGFDQADLTVTFIEPGEYELELDNGTNRGFVDLHEVRGALTSENFIFI